MATLLVERLGGIAGMGLPNSRLVSRGSLDTRQLSADDQAAITRLFAHGEEEPPRSGDGRDGFIYRLTLINAQGEVRRDVDEHSLPETVLRCVRDAFR